MNLIEIFSIIIIHWFADFVVQTHYQASNKSKDNIQLTLHITTYSLCWFIIGTFYGIIIENIWLGFQFSIVTFICHWITDYYTSRLNSKLWREGRVHDFFVSVGFDQVLHYIQLFLTYSYLKQ